MPRGKEHRKHKHDIEHEKKEERAERQGEESDGQDFPQGQIDREEKPATYTALTVDRKDLEETPPAGAEAVGAAYDQQDGITKAVGITLPPDACPDQIPGVPNVPIAAMVVGAAPPSVPGENSPLPDQQPGVPNCPVVMTTDGCFGLSPIGAERMMDVVC
ncbi:hypothetical protein KFL_010430050 [Klebsormidium nitens]|uniref:Uncharacterized protein n=1 Tax=Klebsormidium nitens TaxID=105231 RepID=A0A1Y1INU1_KLENI|nr:hypothetical protein KFL_010430050 [Klebsormidium nitens]|eukprot:GAQ92540.1 hypothetical protein KFL_010430050 [Klebsormidium nitens]